MAFHHPPKSMPSRTTLSRRFLLLVVVLACLSSSFGATFTFGTSYSMPDEDPYKVLGIKRKDQNNMDVIKKAYREKAKKAHPDKNPDLDPEIANQQFHRINAAYEYLSNKDQKLYYDRNRHNQRRDHNQEAQRILKRKEQERRRREEEQRKADRKLARQVQATMVKISSLEDLIESNIVDKKTRQFRKHFLCVFVGNKKIEEQADNEYLFPYPFGPKGRNGIDWTTLMQTAKVRFNKATALTKAFKVPSNPSKPHIVFVQKGTSLDNLRFQINRGRPMEHWVMEQLKTTVTVVNRNPEGSPSLKVYYVTEEGTRFRLKSAGAHIAPGFALEIPSKISDRFVVLDESINEFVGSVGLTRQNSLTLEAHTLESIAMDDVIIEEAKQTIEVGAGFGTTRTCYDLSFTCYTWLRGDATKCHRFSTFAHSMCAKTCGVCIESPHFNGLHYTLMHTPLHRVPKGLPSTIFVALREVAKFLKMAALDFLHIWTMRRTVTAGFAIAGLLLGIQIVLFAEMLLDRKTPTSKKNIPSLLLIGFWLYMTGIAACLLAFLYQAAPSELFHISGLVSFHWDMVSMLGKTSDVAFLFFCIGVSSLVLCQTLASQLFQRPGRMSYAFVLASTIAVSFGMVLLLNDHLDKNSHRSAFMKIFDQKWDMALQYHKNVALAFTVFGYLVGNTLVTLFAYIRHKIFTNIYLPASLTNVLIGYGLLSLALKDPHFLPDLEHVTSMRMSAAIPCLLVGLLTGMAIGHRLFSSSISRAVTTKRSTASQYHADIKAKVD